MAALACTPTHTCAASAVAAEVSVSPSGMAAVTLELTVRLTDETPSSTIPVRFHLFQPQTAHRPPEYVSEHPYAAGAEVVYEGQRWRNESGQTLRRPPGSRPTAWAPLGPALPLAPPPPLAVAETVRLDNGDGNVLVKRQTVRPAAAAQRRFDHARRAAGRSAALTTRTDGGVVVELDRVAVGAAGGAAATFTLEWRGRLADQPLQGTRRLSQLAFVFPETDPPCRTSLQVQLPGDRQRRCRPTLGGRPAVDHRPRAALRRGGGTAGQQQLSLAGGGGGVARPRPPQALRQRRHLRHRHGEQLTQLLGVRRTQQGAAAPAAHLLQAARHLRHRARRCSRGGGGGSISSSGGRVSTV